MKRLFLILLILTLAGCTSSYIRGTDGTITAKNGTVAIVYSADGKTIIGESFTPNNQQGLSLNQLIPFFQSLVKTAP